MDWNDLSSFAAVADTGSTLAASHRLKVSQPTVARRIAALEQAIGLRLFDRLSSGYRLTAAGTALRPAADAVERAVRDLTSAADAQRRRLSGVVRLSAPPVVAELYVAPALTRFKARYPDIQIEIFAQDAPPDFASSEADVAILVGERPQHGQLIARRLATDRMTLFCSAGYAAARGAPRTAEELAGHVILLGAGPLGAAPVYDWLRQVAQGATTGYPASNVAAHVASVRAGHGLGVMPRRLFGRDPDLVACFDLPDEFSVDTWLAAPERLRDEPSVRALLDFIAGFRGEPPEFYRKAG